MAKIDLGRAAAPSFGAIFRALAADKALRRGLADGARELSASGASPADAASQLVVELERLAAAGPLLANPVSAPTWRTTAERMNEAAVPGGASAEVESIVSRALAVPTEPFDQ